MIIREKKTGRIFEVLEEKRSGPTERSYHMYSVRPIEPGMVFHTMYEKEIEIVMRGDPDKLLAEMIKARDLMDSMILMHMGPGKGDKE